MTNAEFAIISLLAETPAHGYELERVIEYRGMREWTEIGFSSIYYILKKLETAGLVSAKKEASDMRGPARNIYSLTTEGRDIWKKSALEILETPSKTYRSLDLGLANIPALSTGDVLDALLKYKQNLTSRRDDVLMTSRMPHNQVLHVQIMFDLALSQINAELGWLNRTIERLNESEVT